MKTIETNVHISENRTFQVTAPVFTELAPGDYHVVMVFDEIQLSAHQQNIVKVSEKPLHLNVFEWNGWPDDCTFRREDMYGDDGR